MLDTATLTPLVPPVSFVSDKLGPSSRRRKPTKLLLRTFPLSSALEAVWMRRASFQMEDIFHPCALLCVVIYLEQDVAIGFPMVPLGDMWPAVRIVENSEGKLTNSDAARTAWMAPVRVVVLEKQSTRRWAVSVVPSVTVLNRDWHWI